MQAMTFMRVLVHELSNALARVLPPDAYTEIKGTRKKGMTDTKPHYLRERLTEIFGPAGYGWWFEVFDLVSEYNAESNNPWTSTCQIKFYYRYIEDGNVKTSYPIIGIGGVSMDRKDFAERGAVTNAIGDAVKLMGWQKGLWAGKYNHQTAGKMYDYQQKVAKEWREKGTHVPGDPVPEERPAEDSK